MAEKPFYVLFLELELARRKSRNEKYSLRAFARDLDVNVALLSQLMAQKLLPTPNFCTKILQRIGAAKADRSLFLESVGEIKKNEFIGESEFITDPPVELADDVFKIISEVHHYEILELTFTEQFSSDPNWIAKALGLPIAEVIDSLNRLEKIGLIEKSPKGFRKTNRRITTKDRSHTSAALRKHQRQILNKALDSLENDPIDCRSMTSMTLAINKERLSLAKSLIEEFMTKMSQLLETGTRTEVYNMGISLFPANREVSHASVHDHSRDPVKHD